MSTNWTRLHLRLWGTSSRMLGRVPVVADGISTYGMYDEKTEVVFDEQVISIENALTVKTEELGHLRYGDAITVDDVPYIVRYEPKRFGDGLLCVMSLERQQPVVMPGVFEPGVFQPGVFA
jgi:hypothetical protein